MRAPVMVSDPEAGVTVTAELHVVILFDKSTEHVLVRLNALPLNVVPNEMISLPYASSGTS